MSSERTYGAADGSRSQLAKGSSVTGDLQFPGTVELMGEVRGSVGALTIVVTESSVVDGSLVAHTVTLRGKFDGEMTCDAAHLHAGSQVTGRIPVISTALTSSVFSSIPRWILRQTRRLGPPR